MSASSSLPALLGGAAIRPQGPPDWPAPDPDVRAALEAAYADGSWGKYHGGRVERLEEKLARYHGVEFALTCGSGTFAIEVALRALRVEPGDEVLLAAYDYPGNFLGIHAVGATPVLVDVDPGDWNLALDQLAAAISSQTRMILAAHLHGGLVPMRELAALAAERGLQVIEDAAQATGAMVQGRRAGAWGDVGVLSFGGSKLLSGGRGGALLTRRADVAQRARLFLHRGNHICPLSELQAAVLSPQLEKLDTRNKARARNVSLLDASLGDIPGLRRFASHRVEGEPAYYKVGFQYDSAAFGLPRTRFIAALRAEGIAFDEGFRALHAGRSPRRFRQVSALVEAQRAHDGCVMLHHPILLEGPAAVEEIVLALRRTYANRDRLAGPL